MFGYWKEEIVRALYKHPRRVCGDADMERRNFAIIPFYKPVSGKLGRLLKKSGIRTTYHPPTETGYMLRLVKDVLVLHMSEG